MMVLIMANINYLVILICSTVFLLSSFVSSQQKSKNAGDPREFYNYAVYLRTHHPEYYAKNYYGIIGHYNKLISATEAKRNRSYGGISKNNRKLKRNGPSVPNGQPSPSVSTTPTIITTPTTTTSDATQPLTTLTSTTEARATIEVANVSVPPNGTSLVENSRSWKLKIGSKIVKRSSRSLNSTVRPEETTFASAVSESKVKKLRNLEDPTEFYNHALYLRTHYPEYYAKNFKGITDHYNKLISAKEAKRVSLNRRTSNNNGQRNGVTNSAGPITPVQDNRSSKLARRIPQDNNVSPSRPKSTEKAGRAHSRSLTSTESSELKAFKNMLRSNSSADTDRMEPELAWAHTCFTLGYNNTNGSCQSEPEEIELAPNQTICRSYFKFGCQYQLNQELCVAAVDKVMKNTSFNCDFNINGDSEWMSVQCCMACKSGINTAISKDSCDMHSDNSMPSFAQEKCCNIFLNQNISVSTTESIPVSFKPGSMNAIISDLDDQVSNSTTFKLSNSLDSTTESIKPGSLNEVVVHLEDRFSNNETNKPEIDSSTVPETSTLPTTTTTIATPSTSTESTTAPSTTTTAATTTTTTTELTTTTSTTTTKSPITSETTTLQPTTSDPTSLLALRSFEEDPNPENPIPDGYRLRDAKKNLYEKMDEEDRSKADFLVILKKELEMDSDARYKDFTLMNITLRRNIRCNWEFKIEKVDPEDGVKTLTEKDFKPKPEKHRFILLIDSEEVQPQTIQYSVSCNIKQYKYYKYIVNLTIINK